MYYVNGLEYLGRPVKIKGKKMEGVEAKRFVTLKKTDKKPSKNEVLELAKAKKGVKKVWVMQMEGNKWKKVMDTIDV
ncbi:MAG: hypothetical protein V3V63_05325 [Candidatus Hydrothermarchaeaceae archaeon]|jgi:hypothetical protein